MPSDPEIRPDPRAELQALQRIARAFGASSDADRWFVHVVDEVTRIAGAERASLFRVEAATRTLRSRVVGGGARLDIRLPIGHGIAGWVAEHSQTLNLPDAYDDDRFEPEVDRSSGFRTRAVLCVPIRGGSGAVIGVLQVLNKVGGGAFSATDQALIETVLPAIGSAMENQALVDTVMRRQTELETLVRCEVVLREATDPDALIEGILLATAGAVGGPVVLVRAGHGAVGVRGGAFVELGQGVATGAVAEAMAGGPAAEGRVGAPLDGMCVGDERGVVVAAGPGAALAVVLAPSQHVPHEVLALVAGRLADGLEALQRRRRAQEVDRLETIGRMLSGILHDFRTPMSIITGYSHLLEDEDDPKEQHLAAERIRGQVGHMGEMIQEILAFARGERTLLVREVLVNAYMDELGALLREEFQRTPFEVTIDVRYRSKARLDPAKIRRAALNLARNAREALGDRAAGAFRFEVDREGSELVLVFSDDGPGIPEAVVPTLFHAFVTHGKQGGTGLGLAMVREIAEAHGGAVSVTSEVGEGTTFRLSLPQADWA